MTIDLDALEKLADEATPGPWTTRTLENFGWNVVHYRNRDRFNIERVSKCAHEENAVFIAAANPATIKALIAELKEARGLLSEWMGTWDIDASGRGIVPIADDTRAFLARKKGEG